jgi:predicted  nucleic acid-binding Zn-ribbon protein
MKQQITEQDLPDLKKEIDQAKSRKSQKEGRLEGLAEDLKNKWKCESFKQGKEKKQSLEEELEQVQEKLDAGLERLQEKYDL